MPYTICKEFSFSAAHQLVYLSHKYPDHQCARPHGHNYVIRVWIQSESLNEDGFVEDYGNLSWFKDLIDSKYDHRDLNDVMKSPSGHLTTAESLARHFYDIVKHHYFDRPGFRIGVDVEETPKTKATYYDQ